MGPVAARGHPMRLSRSSILLAVMVLLVGIGSAAAQDVRALDDHQVDTILRRAEGLLLRGQAASALRVVQPATRSLLWASDLVSEANGRAFYARALALGCTAVVRLGGARTYGNAPATDRRAALLEAERGLRDLRSNGNATWEARHGEALVALGDRMPEAYELLAALHARGAIVEPESYAALVLAARATSHAEVATQARERCVAQARSRARRVCPR